ncbi:MAG: helix-turn-helix domain-containing protein [Candidatus Gastranaerophilales bacterium]|nr:helix-turn-helix domain-containing protein [Candidatus Gastranaerophilales bacterium]
MKTSAVEKYEAYMTVEDVCRYLVATKETVYRWIKKKGLPAHRIGKRWMFRRSKINSWVESGKAAEL